MAKARPYRAEVADREAIRTSLAAIACAAVQFNGGGVVEADAGFEERLAAVVADRSRRFSGHWVQIDERRWAFSTSAPEEGSHDDQVDTMVYVFSMAESEEGV